jgi:hypothetical protein
MNIYTLPDGTKINAGVAFSCMATVDTVDDDGRPISVEDELKFGADWLTYATPEDLERMGITVEEVPDAEPAPPPASPDPMMPKSRVEILIDAMRDQGIVTAEQADALQKAIIVG